MALCFTARRLLNLRNVSLKRRISKVYSLQFVAGTGEYGLEQCRSEIEDRKTCSAVPEKVCIGSNGEAGDHEDTYRRIQDCPVDT